MSGSEGEGYGTADWLSPLSGEVTPAGLPLNSNSQAAEISRIVKSGEGSCFGFSGFSNAGAQQFILAFDAVPSNTATGLTNGQVPVFVLSVPAASNFSSDWGQWGRSFTRGFILACSSTFATLTLGTATCWFDAQYV